MSTLLTSPVAQTVKCLPTTRETWVQSLGREDPLKRKWQPTPVFLPGEPHKRRSLVSYSPWGRKESDTTERHLLYFTMNILWAGMNLSQHWGLQPLKLLWLAPLLQSTVVPRCTQGIGSMTSPTYQNPWMLRSLR